MRLNPLAAAILCLALMGQKSAFSQCGGSQLNFPRLSFADGTLTGAAVVNPNGADALISFTAYDPDGELLEGENFANPADFTVKARSQFAKPVRDIFGASLDPDTVGWFQVCSAAENLTGFFLFLDLSSFSLLDGADLPPSSEKIVFNEIRIGEGLSTELNVINPTETATELLLQLFTDSPDPVAEQSATLQSKGMVRLDVAQAFALEVLPPGATVVVTSLSGVPVAGFEFVGSSGFLNPLDRLQNLAGGGSSGGPLPAGTVTGDVLGLNARPALEMLNTLYFPQLAVGRGTVNTEVSVTNYSTGPEIVTLSAYMADGSLYADDTVEQNLVTRNLPAMASVRVDAHELFGFPETGVFEGWLKVEATSETINGAVSYSVPAAGSLAAVSSTAAPARRAIFSHLATAQGFFTGVALLNPGAQAANVRIIALRPDGEKLGMYGTVLTPGQRISELISAIIPQASGQSGGSIWVRSDLPIYLTSLFGVPNIGLPVLANIPPQPAPESYEPDGGGPFLTVAPVQAFPGLGAAIDFEAPGAGEVEWTINNDPQADPGFGTLDTASGLYTAPAQVPAPLPVTVTAATPSNTGTASVDVLDPREVFSGFGTLQSLVHLEGLKALYTAELVALGSMGQQGKEPDTTGPSGAQSTQVVEISQQDVRSVIAEFPGETISKMVSFTASDDSQHLILSNQTTGEILGLNPLNRLPVVLAQGFDQPSTMAYDTQGNLVVADAGGFSLVSREDLEAGVLSGATGLPPGLELAEASETVSRFGIPGMEDFLEFESWTKMSLAADIGSSRGTRARAAAPDRTVPNVTRLQLPGQVPFFAGGMVTDRCTGDLYFTIPGESTLVQLVRATGTTRVVAKGLDNPGQILGFYRRGVGCPFAFKLLVLERGRDRVLAVSPQQPVATLWVGAEGGIDLVFLSGTTRFAVNGTVLVARNLRQSITAEDEYAAVEEPGRIVAVDVPGLFRNRPDNPPATCPGPFELVDPGLAAAVSEALKIEPGQLIPCEEARQLTFLDAASRNIRDLNGIQYFRNLQTLDLSQNRISNPGPLAALVSLVDLDLSLNRIGGLAPLSGLSALRTLNLTENDVTSLTSLGSLSGLLGLSLAGNSVEDIAPLSKLVKLRVLFLGRNRVQDLEALSGLRQLIDLRLEQNLVEDLAPLSGLSLLRSLNLLGNNISDVRPLSDLTRLTILELALNNVADVGPLSELTLLTQLGLTGNAVSKIEPLASLVNLNTLFVTRNAIADLSPVTDLHGLVDFRADDNEIQDLQPLAVLLALNRLDLAGNLISQIGPLVENTGLSRQDLVDLRGNPLTQEACPDILILVSRGVTVFVDNICG